MDVNSVSNRKAVILTLLGTGDASFTTLLYESKRLYAVRRRYGLHRLAINSLIDAGTINRIALTDMYHLV